MASNYQGYFRNSTVYQNQVVFLCEDDLWQVNLQGGKAYRLTSARSEIASPVYSPDGQWIACCTREEGEHDVYILPSEGGPLRRLTYLNTALYVVGWTPDSQHIIFRSAHQAIHRNNDAWLYMVSHKTREITRFNYGPATFLSYAPKAKGLVLGRNTISNSRWKRYRGGTQGEVWIDPQGKGHFYRILKALQGNPIYPFWIEKRIYFISDHEDLGNLYSCDLKGEALQQETFQQKFYVRYPSTNGTHVVYHAGGDLWAHDLKTKDAYPIPIQWHSPQTQTQRKFVYGDEYFEDIQIHPHGHAVALTSRGKLFSMPLWEDAVTQYGIRNGVRYRLVSWLPDGRLVTVTDQTPKEEKLAVFKHYPVLEPERLIKLPAGRVQDIICSPNKNQVVLTTSRMELYLLDVDKGRLKKLDSSAVKEIKDVTFSPDGRWIAYTKALNMDLTAIFIADLESKKIHQVTQPIRYDFGPSFDPEGRWLYFLSSRNYNPIWDTVQFATTFSRSVKPYLITLKKDIYNPFLPEPHAPGKAVDLETPAPVPGGTESKNSEKTQKKETKPPKKTKKKEEPEIRIEIDFEGIEQRIIEFPVVDGLYEQILGLHNKVLFSEFPLNGDFDLPSDISEADSEGTIWMYDFEKQEQEQIASPVEWMQINTSSKTLLYSSGSQIRVIESGISLIEGEELSGANRKSGWLDLKRVRISVDYPSEWKQMFQEAWRLQKEFFWNEELSGVDWAQVSQKYFPLLDRIASRSELSDLIWEMQGELATSHTYEWGGDYPYTPQYHIGHLGAELAYDSKEKGYVIQRIYQGDVWKKGEHSPLSIPGIQVKEGDVIVGIGGVPLDKDTTPEEMLVHQAGQNVCLSLKSTEKDSPVRHIVVNTLRGSQRVRYRDWVIRCAKQVTEASEGKIGYIHIPDMHSWGLAEFHRGYLAQTHKEGLIIDVRYNGGGLVSPLILEKLTHQHLGYDVPRWGTPESYPYHTVKGPLVALTNEFCGSDGDMFCHSFKTLKLGTLVGKRTWGGVVGIDSRYQLVDSTTTTQPQYAIWFHNAGWSVENLGVEPDLEAEYAPQDYAKGKDPQLEVAIEEILRLLKQFEEKANKLPTTK
ncbi:S41 family peptidase [Deltaproteobacteria bacterium TL4]